MTAVSANEERASGTELLATLRGARLLRGVSAERLAELSALAHTRRYGEGALLWRADDPATSFTIVKRGLVQIVRHAAGREPAMLGIFGPRESIGDAAALAGARYPADAVAMSDEVVVVRLAREQLVSAMAHDPSLAAAVQNALLDHTQALTAKIDVVSAGSVGARMATLLLQLGERFGDEDADGTLSIPLSLSRAALAQLVSARVETVIRTLSAFAKEQLVRTAPDGLVLLDLARLRERAREG